jgi:hypothetical protein
VWLRLIQVAISNSPLSFMAAFQSCVVFRINNYPQNAIVFHRPVGEGLVSRRVMLIITRLKAPIRLRARIRGPPDPVRRSKFTRV